MSQIVKTPTNAQSLNGGVTGTISDTLGKPIPGATVLVENAGKPVTAKTDDRGRYTLVLSEGFHRLLVSIPDGRGKADRSVQVLSGQTIEGVDITVILFGTISGQILNEDKEPIQGAFVFLIRREYRGDILQYVYDTSTRTDKDGKYTLDRWIEPGRAYYVLASTRTANLAPLSLLPSTVSKRPRTLVPTFYGGSRLATSGQALVLSPNEHRSSINIIVLGSPNYCIEAAVGLGDSLSPVTFSLSNGQVSDSGAGFTPEPHGVVPADGHLRLCDLSPGEYRLRAWRQLGRHSVTGEAHVVIADDDVKGIAVNAQPRVRLVTSLEWSEPPSSKALSSQSAPPPVGPRVFVRPMPLDSPQLTEDRGLLGRGCDVPCTIVFDDLLPGNYLFRVDAPGSLYVKDLLLSGISVQEHSANVGAYGDSTLRVLLGNDGGTITVRAQDEKARIIPDGTIVILPRSADSIKDLVSTVLIGRSDQSGTWSSKALAPGSYFVEVLAEEVRRTPEDFSHISEVRSHAQEVLVGSGQSSTLIVTLTRP